MKPEIYEKIKEIADYHVKDDIECAVLIHKILKLAYQLEYDFRIESIDNHIKSISSTCNEKLK